MKIRTFVLFLAPIVLLLAFADPALAVTHGGEGLYGPSNDAAITNMMFFLIAFFPGVIIIMSLYQAWSEHRRHEKNRQRKLDEASAHADSAGW